MRITPDLTVGEIAAAYPAAMRFFESRKIDYCCGGNRTLESICSKRALDLKELVASLETLANHSPNRSASWINAPLDKLIQHIVTQHHNFCRQESDRLLSLLDKVVAQHGADHPEMEEARRLFTMLSRELSTHMNKEEQILFPFIELLDRARDSTRPMPAAFLGSLDNPIQFMTEDHDDAGVLSKQIRTITRNYAVPHSACNSYRALLQGLAEFERDLHVHVHLENNVLFPRARDLEQVA